MRTATLDSYYMKIAISQAMRGERVSPNPRVGCVLVKDDRIVATGYHSEYGKPHAEAKALNMAGPAAEGCTAYVTLEPCVHEGKTPPCAQRLVREGVTRVVIGSLDPDPRVNGKGIDKLAEGGVEVVPGILENECKWINRGFFRSQILSRPWVTLKAAVTLDGKIALESGESKWITSFTARRHAHLLRSVNDAVMVGAGTCRMDQPKLTLRHTSGVPPLKIIIDPHLSIPASSPVFKEGRGTVIAGIYTENQDIEEPGDSPFKVVKLQPSPEGELDPTEILTVVKDQGVNYLLIEGGARVASLMLEKCLIDEVILFMSPRIMGRGLSFSDHFEVTHMKDTICLVNVRIGRTGRDIRVEGVLECSPAL